jgi:hypothetical protein
VLNAGEVRRGEERRDHVGRIVASGSDLSDDIGGVGGINGERVDGVGVAYLQAI